MDNPLLPGEPFPGEIPPSILIATISISDLTALDSDEQGCDLRAGHESALHWVDLIIYGSDESADWEAFENALP